ncbi:Asp23/Gls24 family envelope stress response protein [Geodermatophilus sp. DSM 44513]|uniref:Asp23/Gls24 family envelope stress response protein n=1 Tax=Geodermatophilus sp. DSM 44513 TaxID=1528104 RepID=UPI00127BBCCC|nr:Asp23/Gls24 family envelope stress response protein [Geodermatophilus sp. DSM 44513]WNV75122.1 Asp23/Gls24 family envelope stress response protein [Geodermatophilus sp. DSM 44513]
MTAPAADALPGGPPEERGSLTVADRVVERVAGYAATQVDGAAAAPRRVLGISVGESRPDAEAAVRATVDGSVATVEATIAVAWPQSARRVTDALRARIREDVRRITDVEVAHVDVDVVDFVTTAAPARRVQ